MIGYPTSYVGMFEAQTNGRPVVTSIEIPLIQRDYAQGRRGHPVAEIRARFLDVLYEAVAGEKPVGLDFIYGDVTGSTLRPLDGQQRLTTLFLLHWYFAVRSGQLHAESTWTRFTYATRASARLFCERLVAYTPPVDLGPPSAWITDQPWYLHVWAHDPTISSMLVMLRAIAERFADCDPQTAWRRLANSGDPAVTFQLLPIEEMGEGEELYIRMNSRGKPLTEFETFKALFERAIDFADRSSEFDQKVDGSWADLLWPLRGSSHIVDNHFLRYMRFITDICQWRASDTPRGPLQARALRTFGADSPDAAANLEFLFHAFDTWVGADIAHEFRSLFTTAGTERGGARVLLFSASGTNLFSACCNSYDSALGLGYARTLLLYAVLRHRANPCEDFPRRLRVLRNLIEASENELRPQRLPALIADVGRVVVERSLDNLVGFNRAQIEDERAKWDFVTDNPQQQAALQRLEDHPLLRGSLQAFELDADLFSKRAEAFERIMADGALWSEFTGALLAVGNYARVRNNRDLQFGSPTLEGPWRLLLTGTFRSTLENVSKALGAVLDRISASEVGLAEELRSIQQSFLHARQVEEYCDWRYYFVRYAAMREGDSGIYASPGGRMGYSICMLNKTQMNGHYRDPYLLAVVREAHAEVSVDGGTRGGPWFRGGYVTDPRWVYLLRSGTGLRCVPDGFALSPPTREDHRDAFERICIEHGIDSRHRLVVPQSVRGGEAVDTNDRVQVGVPLLRDLAGADL